MSTHRRTPWQRCLNGLLSLANPILRYDLSHAWFEQDLFEVLRSAFLRFVVQPRTLRRPRGSRFRSAQARALKRKEIRFSLRKTLKPDL